MSDLLKRFYKCEAGATAIEYSLIAALIAIGLITVVAAAGTEVAGVFESYTTDLSDARGGG